MFRARTWIPCFLLFACMNAQAGVFLEDFDGSELIHDPAAADGWAWQTGDGEATMTFSQANGTGRIVVDARSDRRNIWWAFIRRAVSAKIDLQELARSDRELRVEARVRTDTAPRRINLHFNHSRTTDFHSHLMEYDLPDTGNWHVISMTTRGFDATVADEVYVQMALMDWGRGRYGVEVDYLKVSVVDPEESGADLGNPLPYHPPISPPESYSHEFEAAEVAMVDSALPGVNFMHWVNATGGENRPLITVGGSHIALLRWDSADFQDAEPEGWGVLELTTEQVYLAETGLEEFGQLRVVEILGGDGNWTRESVTFESLLSGQPIDEVLNPQMIIDVPPALESGGKTLVTISPPVLRRLMTGQSPGLAIYTQGPVTASFYPGLQKAGAKGPRLYLNLKQAPGKRQEKLK